ncbi:MAG: hypothetical protein ACKVQU_28090 [Burkholderiales bacterium]
MATIYRVTCQSSNKQTELEIVDSLNPLPGSDTWSAIDPASWGLDRGTVANWGSTDAHLHGLGSGQIAILEGFSKATKVGDKNKGEKFYSEGNFPTGIFTWRCTNKE